MTYQIIKMGSLYVDGVAKPQPTGTGDIPAPTEEQEISIGHTIQGKEITWIRPDGLDILIADRAIACNMTYLKLKRLGFVEGKLVNIDGQWFRCRLPSVNLTEKQKSEWDTCLDICGTNNNLWHWRGVYTIGREDISTYGRLPSYEFMLRGCKKSPKYYSMAVATEVNADGCPFGFRPVLELTNKHELPTAEGKVPGKVVELEEQRFCLTLPGGNEKFNDWNASTEAYLASHCETYPWGKYGSWTNEHRKDAPFQIVVRGSAPTAKDSVNIHSMYYAGSNANKSGFKAGLGFRPMLVPIDTDGCLDRSVFGSIPNGTIIKMYTLTMNNEPVRIMDGKTKHYVPESHVDITATFKA